MLTTSSIIGSASLVFSLSTLPVPDNMELLKYVKKAYDYNQIQDGYSLESNSFTKNSLDLLCNPRQMAEEVFKRLYKGTPVPEYYKYKKVAEQAAIMDIYGKIQYVIDSESVRISAINNNRELIIDYEFGEDDSILVSSVEGKSIRIRECSVDNLSALLLELMGYCETKMARVA